MYIVLEMQTNTDGTVGTLVYSYDNKNEAESKYHEILMYAATSTLPAHTAMLLTSYGQIIKTECYRHEVELEEVTNEG